MKKALILIIMIFLCISCTDVHAKSKDSKKKRSNILFEWYDFQDDDRGPGYYTYPKHRSYTEGTFDIIHFFVEESKDTIDFRIGIYGDIMSEASGVSEPNGFIHQMLDIYIDTDQKKNSGHTVCLPGRNAEFDENSGWEKVVLITPKDREYVIDYLKHRSEEINVLETIRKDIVIPKNYYITRREIIARVDKKLIGKPQPWWGYQLLMIGNSAKVSSSSFRGTTYDFATGAKPNSLFNLEVLSFPGLFNFGGGSDYDGNPNIIDMLTDKGQSQKNILSEYKSHPNPQFNKWVKISCVYKSAPPKETPAIAGTQKNYTEMLAELRKRNEEMAKQQKETEQILTSGREKVNLDIGDFNESAMEENYQKVMENSIKEKKEEVFPEIKVEKALSNQEICTSQMERIYDAASRYRIAHPEDKNITLYDLISEGFLAENIMCPEGGRYAIYGEDTESLKVRCFNPAGVEHGIFQRRNK